MTNSQSSLPDPWGLNRPGDDRSPRLVRGEVLGAADREARAAPPPLSPWETPRAARADFLRDPQGSTLSPETKEFLMGIFSRARDIIQANVSDLLERAEDPAKTIRLVIMEMEETLVEVRASAARTIADQKEMRRTIVKLEQAQQSWGEKAELALSKGREDLAEAALLEKQKVRSMAEQMTAETDALAEQLSAHEDDILKLEAKLREARARQTSVLARLETAQNRARVRAMTKGARVEEAFSRFDILERRVDLAEGRAEAYDLGGNRKSLDDEIADLRAADAVKAELAALKARLGREG